MSSFEEILLKISRSADVDSDQLGVIGKQAAKRLIEDGVHPNVTIQKLATEKGLNSHEIQRACEFANLEGYSHRMKEAGSGDKTFEFPVADASEITSSKEPEKTAMPSVFSTEYDFAPDSDLCSVDSDMDVYEAFGVAPLVDKVASLHRADALIEKLELLAQNERDKLAMNLEELKENAEKFYGYIKQEVLKGKSFDEVRKAVETKAEGTPYKDRILELTAYVKRRLYDAGVLQTPAKTGDSGADPTLECNQPKTAEPVERDLITDIFESPYVPVSVINGRHPMFASIDTLVRQFDERDTSKNNLIILDDKIRYTKDRVYGKKQPL